MATKCGRLGYVIAAAVLGVAPAGAETGSFEARGSGSTFVADDGAPLANMATSGQVRFVWDKDPIVRRNKSGDITETVVAHQLESQLVLGLGLFDRLELGAQVTGRFQASPTQSAFDALQGVHLAPPRLSARFLALDLGWLQTSVRLRGALIDHIEPGVVIVVDPGPLRFTLDAGLQVSPTMAQAPFALSVKWLAHEHLELTGEVFGAYAGPGRVPVEFIAGARSAFGPVAFVAGLGGGLVPDVGTPAIRVFGAVQWRFEIIQTSQAATIEMIPEPVAPPAPAVDDVAPPPPAAAATVPVEAAAPPVAVAVAEESQDVSFHDGGVTFADHVVLFEVERDALIPDSRTVLRLVAHEIKARPDMQVVIEGHADGLGNPAYNRKLSAWRAHAVRRALIAYGVPPSRLEVRGAGSAKPIAPNTTTAGRRQNRRVEITFEPGHAVGTP
jgi:outer membrane protein OmpA-like peptidoglycan-associated protein